MDEILEKILCDVKEKFIKIANDKGNFHSIHEALGHLEEERMELLQSIIENNIENIKLECDDVIISMIGLRLLLDGEKYVL